MFSAELPVLFSFVQVSGYLGTLEKSQKKNIKNQHFGSFRKSKGGPQGSQEGSWRGPAPGRATCPPGLVPRPPVPYFCPIYSPDAETPKQKSLFQSTSRSHRNPLFFSGELIWRLLWPPVRGNHRHRHHDRL